MDTNFELAKTLFKELEELINYFNVKNIYITIN